MNRYKHKTCISAVYKSLASDLERHTNWKWGDWQTYSTNGNQKKAQTAILISDEIDLFRNRLRIKTVIGDQKRTLHNNQGINTVQRYKIINIYAPNQ